MLMDDGQKRIDLNLPLQKIGGFQCVLGVGQRLGIDSSKPMELSLFASEQRGYREPVQRCELNTSRSLQVASIS